MNIKSACLVLALCAAATGAHAQTRPVPCAGRVAIDTVYSVHAGAQRFDYHVQFRNTGDRPLRLQLNLGQFPAGVQLFSPVLPNMLAMPRSAQSMRFGFGNKPLSLAQVSVSIDQKPSGIGPYMHVNSCSLG